MYNEAVITTRVRRKRHDSADVIAWSDGLITASRLTDDGGT
jgi:hypothetical protein